MGPAFCGLPALRRHAPWRCLTSNDTFFRQAGIFPKWKSRPRYFLPVLRHLSSGYAVRQQYCFWCRQCDALVVRCGGVRMPDADDEAAVALAADALADALLRLTSDVLLVADGCRLFRTRCRRSG